MTLIPIKDRIQKIYLITFPNGKQYVGLTERRIEDRWKQHKHSVNDSCINYPVVRALRELNGDFSGVSVEWIASSHRRDFLFELEKAIINERKTYVPLGYNAEQR